MGEIRTFEQVLVLLAIVAIFLRYLVEPNRNCILFHRPNHASEVRKDFESNFIFSHLLFEYVIFWFEHSRDCRLQVKMKNVRKIHRANEKWKRNSDFRLYSPYKFPCIIIMSQVRVSYMQNHNSPFTIYAACKLQYKLLNELTLSCMKMMLSLLFINRNG